MIYTLIIRKSQINTVYLLRGKREWADTTEAVLTATAVHAAEAAIIATAESL